MADEGAKITRDLAIDIEDAGIKEVWLLDDEGKEHKVIGNHFVTLAKHLDFDISD